MDVRKTVRSHRGLLITAFVIMSLLVLVMATTASADPLLAVGDPGSNIAKILKKWGTELYGGVVAVFSIGFLLKKQIKELLIFLVSALLVGWMVLSPDSVAQAGRGIVTKIFG